MNRPVLFRVDSGSKIGIGHVRRCANLATSMKNSGIECVFVCLDLPNNISNFLRENGFRVYTTDISVKELGWVGSYTDQYHGLGDKTFSHADQLATGKIIDSIKPSLIIVDHYFLAQKWETHFKQKGIAIVVIDDLANRPHNCDILIDQNFFGSEARNRYKNLVPAHSKKLFGPSYALIERKYANSRNLKKFDEGDTKVLISLGGSDPDNVTGLILQFLLDSNLPNLSYKVVLGPSNIFRKEIETQLSDAANFKIFYSPESLFDLTHESDIVIGAGGSSTWERMALGTPSLIVGIAENQMEISQFLADKGLIIYLGKSEELNSANFTYEFKKLLSSHSKRHTMAQQNKKLVDGLGTEKVCEEVIKILKTEYS